MTRRPSDGVPWRAHVMSRGGDLPQEKVPWRAHVVARSRDGVTAKETLPQQRAPWRAEVRKDPDDDKDIIGVLTDLRSPRRSSHYTRVPARSRLSPTGGASCDVARLCQRNSAMFS